MRQSSRSARQPISVATSATWWAFGFAAVVGCVLVASTVAEKAVRDRHPPRIVSAVAQDLDQDGRVDHVRLTYSEPVRHRRDTDGRYPFRVGGNRVRSVGAARGQVVVLTLAKRPAAGAAGRPVVVYRRVARQPVLDLAGNQAATQRIRTGRRQPVRPEPPGSTSGGPGTVPGAPGSPPSNTPRAVTDRDGDGFDDVLDCGPADPAIRPGAIDLPELRFVDANCDGIDGDPTRAVFASPRGDDMAPGTRARPKREISAAVAAAAGTGKYVVAAAGTYDSVTLTSGVDIFGGYDPSDWSRRANLVTAVVGSPQGIYADKTTGVVLELLRVIGATRQVNSPPGLTFYGIRAVNGSRLTLRRVTSTASRGRDGVPGANGTAGANGAEGAPGADGECDGSTPGQGGAGGASPAGRPGGAGGAGGHDTGGSAGTGRPGEPGVLSTPGGAGGPSGDPGRDGAPGTAGAPGILGPNGTGGAAIAGDTWMGQNGGGGIGGTAGQGGGGGGGGGGQQCVFCDDGSGDGGGGGGGGAAGGGGGAGGSAGGGSFGIYLNNSTVTVTNRSSAEASEGGAGGPGGAGAPGGFGGAGGLGSRYCRGEIGEGGDGGFGGQGGHGGGGGGGAGGPSVGIYGAGVSTVTITPDSTATNETGGLGGIGGPGGAGSGGPGLNGPARPIYP